MGGVARQGTGKTGLGRSNARRDRYGFFHLGRSELRCECGACEQNQAGDEVEKDEKAIDLIVGMNQ